MLLRSARPDDVPSIQSIYAQHVRHGLATFEEEPPSTDEMRQRLLEVKARSLPYLVAEEAETVVGYGYCAPYRLRSAYRYTLEDSIYVKEGHHRKGIGRALLGELILACEQLNYRQLIAVIGDSAQTP
jgi:phosphinothricin acetyltransferase